MVGLLLGVAALGGLLGALVTKRIAARIGVGWAYAVGLPAVHRAAGAVAARARAAWSLVLATLFAAEFVSGFGVMMLDISIGAIFAAVIPGPAQVPGHRRVPGGQLRHPAARRAARRACSGASFGLRPALWMATLGGVAGSRCCCWPRRCRGSGCRRTG